MTQDTSSSAPDGIPAATVVIFRNTPGDQPPELLMVTRSRNMSFAGGAAVFPGGRVDPEDFDLAKKLSNDISEGLDLDEAAHRIAAIRETLEETGLAVGIIGDVDAERAKHARNLLIEHKAFEPVLSIMGWGLDLSATLPFSRWFPKNENLSRVFDTRFYLADLGTGAVELAVDQTENTKLYWITAQGALDAADAGDLTLIFPTRRNLERLAEFKDFPDADTSCTHFGAKMIVPFLEEADGEKWLCIRDDAGYPVTRESLSGVLRG